MAKTPEQYRAIVELKSKLSDCRLKLKDAARKRGYLLNNFCIDRDEKERAIYVTSGLNHTATGEAQCEDIMRMAGYKWEVVTLQSPVYNIEYKAYKISF